MPENTKVGVVRSTSMNKTVVVGVERLVPHPVYKRTFRKTSTFMVHDEQNACRVGDRVRIVECRPLSKRKRWRLIEILESPASVEEAAARAAEQAAEEAAKATEATE